MPKVLLVNTQPYLRLLLEKRFEKEGFEVQAASWEESLRLVGAASLDLIVLGQDAEHQLAQLLTGRGARRVPVILLTPSEAGADAPPGGEVAQLKMPFRPSQLVALARKAVSP